ncbi:fructosamine kinase family protein [Solitalea lacus]|uniref:fructosamine kinase family protein n=1 Tax=Solitalea lacus TaxID=2911172 RepID=UPI001EDA8385|nr:fructosamine kinase family protein [Solitalea lacus]UKJ05833.1 fructosamine kinase family protein [Solitalea lacus]
MKNTLQQAASQALHEEIQLINIHPVNGGSINSAAKLITSNGIYFIKWNDASEHLLFEAEAFGLKLLKKNIPELIPELIGWGVIDYTVFLMLEWIEPISQLSNYWKDFAEKLSKLHRSSNSFFGLDHNNFIGSLPQFNNATNSWVDFFITNRLQTQTELAFNNNLLNNNHLKLIYNLYSKLYNLLPEEPPALVHGDLWNGNVLCGSNGLARIFDPSVYYGNREVDLAMTTLFGGFDPEFYSAYNEYYPLQPDYTERFPIYNLYPLLVHLNLFGNSYLSPIEEILKRYA